ncbi:hypothetical protein [Thiorhodospira sibirica]|uniref:hypothetical protein n=1 Tax=Thiorhodospira sibirica TaxID=154347 RepID=UPI00022C5E13|nr:hypothetical protein [Thiorhodospira sibirica]
MANIPHSHEFRNGYKPTAPQANVKPTKQQPQQTSHSDSQEDVIEDLLKTAVVGIGVFLLFKLFS